MGSSQFLCGISVGVAGNPTHRRGFGCNVQKTQPEVFHLALFSLSPSTLLSLELETDETDPKM